MKRVLILFVIVAFVATAAYTVITLYDENMQVGRMWETPGVKPHEAPIPVTETGIVPFAGGEALMRTTVGEQMVSPVALNDPAAMEAGKKGYAVYCIHCHGERHDGNGTVGQSFAPLPGDLRSEKVQSMAPGILFHEISYGISGGRQPALATTIEAEERWRIISYIQSLGVRKQ